MTSKNKYVVLEWLIKILGYALVLITVSIIFKNTIYIDNSYWGLWAVLASLIVFILNKIFIKPFKHITSTWNLTNLNSHQNNNITKINLREGITRKEDTIEEEEVTIVKAITAIRTTTTEEDTIRILSIVNTNLKESTSILILLRR